MFILTKCGIGALIQTHGSDYCLKTVILLLRHEPYRTQTHVLNASNWVYLQPENSTDKEMPAILSVTKAPTTSVGTNTLESPPRVDKSVCTDRKERKNKALPHKIKGKHIDQSLALSSNPIPTTDESNDHIAQCNLTDQATKRSHSTSSFDVAYLTIKQSKAKSSTLPNRDITAGLEAMNNTDDITELPSIDIPGKVENPAEDYVFHSRDSSPIPNENSIPPPFHTFYGTSKYARGFGSEVKHSTADPGIASSIPPHSN